MLVRNYSNVRERDQSAICIIIVLCTIILIPLNSSFT